MRHRLVVAAAALLASAVMACSAADRMSTWTSVPVAPTASASLGISTAKPSRSQSAAPTNGPSPTPTVGRLPQVVQLPDRVVRVGSTDLTLTKVRSVALTQPAWDGGYPLDANSVVVSTAGTDSVDIDGVHVVTGSSTWLADLSSGVLRSIDPSASVVDVDPARGRVLLFEYSGTERGRLHVADRNGERVATLGGTTAPTGVFLDDGTVAVADFGRIGVWDPAGHGEVTWHDLPGASTRAFLIAVGSRVIVDDTATWLVDPRSGELIGTSWRSSGPTSNAASPDGTMFATGVMTPGRPTGRVEIRDAATAEPLSTDRGRLLSSVEGIAWPTDDVIVVMRADTGTEQVARPEVHLLGTFGADPVAVEPLVDRQSWLIQRGPTMVAVGQTGPFVVMQARAGQR